MKLNKEAINEIVNLLKEVQEIQNLMKEFGINYSSDTWKATNITTDYRDNEDILSWKKKDFEKINSKCNINKGNIFYIGGCVYTGSEHEYKNKLITAPKQLAKIQGDIVTKYLKYIINSYNSKYFTLEFENPNGLIDNCGWEEYIGINAIVKESALEKNTLNLIEEILKEEDDIIELSSSPLNKNPKNYFSKESQLIPKGNFEFMIEFFSRDLIDNEKYIYEGAYGLNSQYIKDAMKLINKIENKAIKIANKFEDKGVKVTVNGLNDGCEKGMAIYVWIPHQ